MKIFKSIFSVLFWIIIIFLCFLALISIYITVSEKINKASIFGFSFQIGLNYSMKPTLMPNDFLITHKQSEYQLNDIVTFTSKDANVLTTHRIIEITENGYITKGDSTAVQNDKEITNADIIGKVVFVIPYLGAVFRVAKTPYGIIILIAIIVVFGFVLRTLSQKE